MSARTYVERQVEQSRDTYGRLDPQLIINSWTEDKQECDRVIGERLKEFGEFAKRYYALEKIFEKSEALRKKAAKILLGLETDASSSSSENATPVE